MKIVTVSLGERSYPIRLGVGLIEKDLDLLPLRDKSAVAIVTDSNVAPLYAARLSDALEKHFGRGPVLCVMPAGEQNKRMDQIEWLCGEFLRAGMDRSSAVVALGGGVVGDMAGFAASVFMRGIPYVQVPTTVLAQVDSSVGGKTGVNHPLGKNTIGAFHQPSAVLIDLDTLLSLPDRELKAGLAEIVKTGVIADQKLFDYVGENAPRLLRKELDALEWPILRSCEIKAAVVASDEREQGDRANLNYGHTFGHAIEAVTGYGRFLHGEAVALGMQAAAHMAAELGMVNEAMVACQRACLEACGLPVKWPELPLDETMDMMKHDKKWRAGKMLFILPDRLGHVVRRSDVPEELIRAGLESIT